MAKLQKVNPLIVIDETESGRRTLQNNEINCNEILERITQLEKDRSRKMGAIIEQLKILYDNQDLLKEQTELTFKEVIEKYANMSKSNFYSILKSYVLLNQYGKADLLESVDNKLIEYIATQPEKEQKPLLEKVIKKEFSRKDLPPRETAKGQGKPDNKRQFKKFSNDLIRFLNSCTTAEQKKYIKELESEILKAYK